MLFPADRLSRKNVTEKSKHDNQPSVIDTPARTERSLHRSVRSVRMRYPSSRTCSQIWGELDGFLQLSNCFGITASKDVAVAQVRVDDGRKWVELRSAFQLGYGLVDMAERCMNNEAEEVMRAGVVWVKLDCTLKLTLRPL